MTSDPKAPSEQTPRRQPAVTQQRKKRKRSVVSATPLTPREREIMQWVAVGKTDEEIADILSIGTTTVTSHVENAKQKLDDAFRRAEAPPTGYQHPLPDWGKPLSPHEVQQALFGKVAQLLGGPRVLRHPLTTELEAHEMLLLGLPARSVERLINTLVVIGHTEPSLAKALGVSWRTVQRQKKTPEKRLSKEQSGRMWKFAEILAKATEVFGSQPDAEQWMKRPATGLEQRRPIDLLETPAGAELVENCLERLEYGVYT